MALPNNLVRHPSPPVSPPVRRMRMDQRGKEHVRMRMILLLHARKCQEHGTALCDLLHCEEFKDVLKHIPFCVRGRNCRHKFCISSRSIIKHWNSCQSCSICRPVMQCMRNLRINAARRQNNVAPPRGGVPQMAHQAPAGPQNVPRIVQDPQGGGQPDQRPIGNGEQAPGGDGVHRGGARPEGMQRDIPRPQAIQRPFEPLTPPPSRQNWGHLEVQGFYHHEVQQPEEHHPVFFGYPPHQPQYQQFPLQFAPGAPQYYQFHAPVGYPIQQMVPVYHFGF